MEDFTAYTNAPECYDYSYVSTVETKGKWRKVRVTDRSHWENFQQFRYGSGWYQSFVEGEDSYFANEVNDLFSNQ